MPVEQSQTQKRGPFDVGSIIDGRYEIIGSLGQGATATVYKARQKHIERPVAIKVLKAMPLGDRTEFEARFLREAQLAAQIRHPCVVTIHDFGFTDSGHHPHIVMELLSGHDLEEELTQFGLMKPERALPLFVDCLDAIGKGHELGIVHRDLKPANLFLSEPRTSSERMIVLDFGIAAVSGGDTSAVGSKRLTNAGELVGTPCYLAPEYITEQVVTPAVDVYQVGLILVEALTGITVVDDDNIYACINIHCNGDLPIPERIKASPLGPVIAKATALDPKARYVDARAFKDALAVVDPGEVSAVFERVLSEGWSTPANPKVDSSQKLTSDDDVRGGWVSTLMQQPKMAIGAAVVLVLLVVIASVVASSGDDVVEGGIAADEENTEVIAEGSVEEAGPIVADGPKVRQPTDTFELVGTLASAQINGGGRSLEDVEANPVKEESKSTKASVAGDVVVRLDSIPSGGEVYLDSQLLGTTPVDLKFAAGDPVRLTLRKRGFRNDKWLLTPEEGLVVKRKLKKKGKDGSISDTESMRIIP